MRTFAQKQNQSQKALLFSSTRSHRKHSVVHPQAASGLSHLGRDFSGIPIHRPVEEAIHTKMAVNEPGDECELEADQVADKVARSPEQVKTKRVQGAGTGSLAVPPLVHEVLSSKGKPLDSSTRNFMELGFGHDLSGVRVHNDSKAAESARAVSALAYTAGQDMVFGAGQYNPATSEGRRLVAHELTHVVQQEAAPTSAGNTVLQRKPDKKNPVEIKEEQRLKDLAQDPGKAHQAWKKLSIGERIAVAERMKRRYGKAFADKFLEVAATGKPDLDSRYYPFGEGPKPDRLTASGFRIAGVLDAGGVQLQVWVHPSGRIIQESLTQWRTGADAPKKKPEPGAQKMPADEPPPLDPSTDNKANEAMDLLADMHDRNSELQKLCAADSFESGKAEDAQINWTFAHEKLSEFQNVDMNAAYPDFWKDAAAAAAENLDVRRACCKRDPSNYFFSCDELKVK